MTIKCVLFDADGVIITSEMFSSQYEKKYNVSNDEMLPFFRGEFQDCIRGRADLIEVLKPWLSKWNWDGTVDEFLEFWFETEHEIDNRIVEIIKKLQENKIKCYVATNQEKYRTQYMKKHMGFDQLFDDIFSSYKIGHAKPETDYFQFILNKIQNEHNISANEVMFFDDSKEHIEPAKELGINAYHYQDFKEFKEIIEPILNKEKAEIN